MTADKEPQERQDEEGVLTITREDVEQQPDIRTGADRIAERPPRPRVDPGERGLPAPPAGIWVRLLAKLIDLLAVALPLGLGCGLLVLLDALGLFVLPWDLLGQSIPEMVAIALSALWATYALYAIVVHAAAGASIGKRICGICVVPGSEPADRLAYFLARFIVAFIGLLFLGAGHLCMVFRKDRRALHDLVVGSYVVRQPPPTG